MNFSLRRTVLAGLRGYTARFEERMDSQECLSLL